MVPNKICMCVCVHVSVCAYTCILDWDMNAFFTVMFQNMFEKISLNHDDEISQAECE